MNQGIPFIVRQEQPYMAAAVTELLDHIFGEARFEKASHLYRRTTTPINELCYVAELANKIVGTIRYWPILVGDEGRPALLLGPLAIAPMLAGKGIGRALLKTTLDLAREHDHDIVLLVGDVDYYQRFGFSPAAPLGFVMPEETRPERLQVAFLRPSTVIGGLIKAAAGSLPARIAA